MARKASGTAVAAAAAPTTTSAAPTTRSRTGCMTCRKRKLKCDEARPICANCQKGSRECVPAETLTFRNQQNPSLNGGTEDENAGLGNFYKYRDTFGPDRVWVPVPPVLHFVNITNPYGPDPDEETVGRSSDTGYQQMATHTLEALSTAATRDSTSNQQFTSYGSPTYADNNIAYYNTSHAAYPPYAARADMSNALKSPVIDPNLESVSAATKQATVTTSLELTLPFQFKMDGHPTQDGQPDEHTAALLRKFSEGPAS